MIDIQQCSVTNKQCSITFQQCFSIKQTYIELNILHLLSTKYFEFQQFRGYKMNNLQLFEICLKLFEVIEEQN